MIKKSIKKTGSAVKRFAKKIFPGSLFRNHRDDIAPAPAENDSSSNNNDNNAEPAPAPANDSSSSNNNRNSGRSSITSARNSTSSESTSSSESFRRRNGSLDMSRAPANIQGEVPTPAPGLVIQPGLVGIWLPVGLRPLTPAPMPRSDSAMSMH